MTALRIALLTLVLLVGSTLPAAAQEPTPIFEQGTAKEICADNAIDITFGDVTDSFVIPSHGGCISTVATAGLAGDWLELTSAAYVAQCKILKDMLPSFLWEAPVIIDNSGPIPSNVGGFGGTIGSCAKLLRGYHTGTLTYPA